MCVCGGGWQVWRSDPRHRHCSWSAPWGRILLRTNPNPGFAGVVHVIPPVTVLGSSCRNEWQSWSESCLVSAVPICACEINLMKICFSFVVCVTLVSFGGKLDLDPDSTEVSSFATLWNSSAKTAQELGLTLPNLLVRKFGCRSVRGQCGPRGFEVSQQCESYLWNRVAGSRVHSGTAYRPRPLSSTRDAPRR